MRTVHVIDVENLSGKDIRFGTVQKALSLYEGEMVPQPSDTLVVGIAAMHYKILLTLKGQPTRGPNCRAFAFDYITVIGHNDDDGADEALLTAVQLMRSRTPPLKEDFGQAVFASGDHEFVDLAEELEREGISIVNLIGMGGRSDEWHVRVSANLSTIRDQMQDYYRRRRQRQNRQKPKNDHPEG